MKWKARWFYARLGAAAVLCGGGSRVWTNDWTSVYVEVDGKGYHLDACSPYCSDEVKAGRYKKKAIKKAKKMTRREFIKRSAPLIAAGAVSPSFVEQLIWRLFGPKKYWDFYTRSRFSLPMPGTVFVLEDSVDRQIYERDPSRLVTRNRPGPNGCVICEYFVTKPKLLLPVRRELYERG